MAPVETETVEIELPEVQNVAEASNIVTEVKELIESLRAEIAVLVSENNQIKNEFGRTVSVAYIDFRRN